MIKIDVIIERDLPVHQLDQWRDRIVYNIARETLDFTGGHFPVLHGDLERSSIAFGVQGGNKEYGLGYEDTAPYTPEVWKYPQRGTNWTNKQTWAKWYEASFKNNREKIINNAINNSKGMLK